VVSSKTTLAGDKGYVLTPHHMKGGEKYQQAYYVFEELAQAPSTSTASTLVGQAVAEIHLGRLEEAEVALQQALAKDSRHAEALANAIVLSVLAGKDNSDQLRYSVLSIHMCGESSLR